MRERLAGASANENPKGNELAGVSANENPKGFGLADRSARKNLNGFGSAGASASFIPNTFHTLTTNYTNYTNGLTLKNTSIMAELNRRNIHDVANAFHFSTVEKTLTLVMASGLRQTFRPLGALAEELMTRFQREDAAYKQSQKSFTSDDIKDIDKTRDKYAQFIKSVLTAYTYLPESESGLIRQARELLQVFKDYKWRDDEALLAETAKLDNMLQEWDQEQKAAVLTAMGLTYFVDALRTTNADVKSLIQNRQAEQSVVVRGELRAARAEVDEKLQEMLRYIDALNITSPSDDLTDLILKINEAFRYMDAQIAAGKKKGSSDEDSNGGGSSSGGTTVISNEDTIQGLE